jgi:NADPH2:quinone reductase
MKAFHIAQTGAAAAIADIDIPQPAAGQVRIKIAACALNFADLLMEKGTYQDTPPAPFTLGMEVAGTIDAAGEGVDLPIGARVAVFGGSGGLAEYGCFDANRVVALPDDIPFTDAASFLVAYGTSHVALDHRARLQPGETLLVLGAAGGVGLTAVEIGKLMGARVIACARGADKLAIAKQAGADHLIDTDETPDLRSALKDLGGVDVVYDPVGGEQFKAAFRACNPEARLLPIGFASGEVPQVPANHLLVKNLTVMGVYWGGYMGFKPQVITNSLQTLFDWYSAGRLRPHISHTLPLDRARDGLDLLRARKSTGKIVITIPHG